MAAQILYCLSERHTHREYEPSDIGQHQIHACLSRALMLVVDHAAHLPRLHRKQAAHRDTALLLVSPSLTQRYPVNPLSRAQQCATSSGMIDCTCISLHASVQHQAGT